MFGAAYLGFSYANFLITNIVGYCLRWYIIVCTHQTPTPGPKVEIFRIVIYLCLVEIPGVWVQRIFVVTIGELTRLQTFWATFHFLLSGGIIIAALLMIMTIIRKAACGNKHNEVYIEEPGPHSHERQAPQEQQHTQQHQQEQPTNPGVQWSILISSSICISPG
eukprot:m.289457 g.289457  ORF g.289457 m.289457 type:complete len:164 (+) comp16373_c0_seq41:1410-1901(+)